ncbi:MAG TPA: hypothetical protein VMT35_20045, partial [Ignavibacteriaceae bacterium]|nr:hypothetical protein [Ignavibacteriaceae bacterium]
MITRYPSLIFFKIYNEISHIITLKEKIKTEFYLFFKNYLILFLLVSIYSISVIRISSYHEVYRDEMRALSLVLESKSLPTFIHYLKSEGHPALWYFILYIGWLIIKTPLVLKVASLSIAITAVTVFLFNSPFTKIQKGLFIFGALPLYEFSIMSRNYGIGMLLLFIFFTLY